MNSRFLRDEAARFRGMAEDADREATKLRLLAMAVDYEARARIASEQAIADVTAPELAARDLTAPELAASELGEPDNEPEGQAREKATKITLRGKMASGLNEPVVVQRRSPGRPRRE